jgi:hypothetical protein
MNTAVTEIDLLYICRWYSYLTGNTTFLCASAACYGDSFTSLYVDNVRTSQGAHLWAFTVCCRDSFAYVYIYIYIYIRLVNSIFITFQSIWHSLLKSANAECTVFVLAAHPTFRRPILSAICLCLGDGDSNDYRNVCQAANIYTILPSRNRAPHE